MEHPPPREFRDIRVPFGAMSFPSGRAHAPASIAQPLRHSACSRIRAPLHRSGMPERNLRGLELAIYLKSNLLQRLAASALEEWTPHLKQFVMRLEASDLQDATAIAVLLADLRDQLRVLLNAFGQNTSAAAVDERALTEMSRGEVMAWFRAEVSAIVAPVHPRSGPRGRLVENAVNFMAANYAAPITIDTIAQAVGTSKRTLVTLFRRQMGQSVHQYLTQIRLHRSLALIRAGEKIEAVSLMVGYRSRKNFYRQFKAAIGMTPSTYKMVCVRQPTG